MEPYGCGDVTPDSAAGLFAALTARRNGYIQRLREREGLEKTRAELNSKKNQQQALLAALEATLLDELDAGALVAGTAVGGTGVGAGVGDPQATAASARARTSSNSAKYLFIEELLLVGL